MAPGMPFTDVDKPLHLHITPGACSTEVRRIACLLLPFAFQEQAGASGGSASASYGAHVKGTSGLLDSGLKHVLMTWLGADLNLGAKAAWRLAALRLIHEVLTVQDEAEQRRCVEQAASELRQILAGKRLPRGAVYVPGQKPGMGPPQVIALTLPLQVSSSVWHAHFCTLRPTSGYSQTVPRDISMCSTTCRVSSSREFQACPEEPRPTTHTPHPRQVSCPPGSLRAPTGSRRPTGRPTRRLCPACRAPAYPWALRPRRISMWSSA